MQKPIVCLMGPTASGKTKLAIQLIQDLPFEIISVDSALVYRDMNIGTAKPDAETLSVAPHHLIDIRDPAEVYSAAQFREDALQLMSEIHARNKIPLLVGGTMLYFRALQQGLADMPAANAKIRALLSEEALEQGWDALHARLETIDPIAAAKIHPNDAQRIQRALEVYLISGKTISSWQQVETDVLQHHIINLIVSPKDRSVLHKRIEERFDQMLEGGFIEEVQALHARPDLNLETPSMRSVGYRQVWEYLDGANTWDEMRNKGIAATRQLAKRQLTWLRAWPNAAWFDSELPDIYQQVTHCLHEKL